MVPLSLYKFTVLSFRPLLSFPLFFFFSLSSFPFLFLIFGTPLVTPGGRGPKAPPGYAPALVLTLALFIAIYRMIGDLKGQ